MTRAEARAAVLDLIGRWHDEAAQHAADGDDYDRAGMDSLAVSARAHGLQQRRCIREVTAALAPILAQPPPEPPTDREAALAREEAQSEEAVGRRQALWAGRESEV